MNDWFRKLVTDKDGDPSEHIIAAIWGSFAIVALTCYAIYKGHEFPLDDFGAAHMMIWTGAGIGQKLSKDS